MSDESQELFQSIRSEIITVHRDARKGNNQVEIMYLSTSSGKIRFRYDGMEWNVEYDFKGDARFNDGLFLEKKGWNGRNRTNNNKRIKF